jgi:predicted DCC family thiol-disulfide oxidoreductase YuxK
MTLYYDNWCGNCIRFMRWVCRLDWFHLVSCKELRKEEHTGTAAGLNLALAEEQLASVHKGVWKYGYDSLYRTLLRLPLFWLLAPFLWILKVTRLGTCLYRQLAVNRHIVPLHCVRSTPSCKAGRSAGSCPES